jgi:hypothetical protein
MLSKSQKVLSTNKNPVHSGARKFFSNGHANAFFQPKIESAAQAQKKSIETGYAHRSAEHVSRRCKACEDEEVQQMSDHGISTIAEGEKSQASDAITLGGSLGLGDVQRQTVQRQGGDPCSYGARNVTDREIHLNLGLRAVRVYTRSGRGSAHIQFDNIITGPDTVRLARDTGWCTMYPILGRNIGPTSGKGLYNFVLFCRQGDGFGFHSDHWRSRGRIRRIPGAQSHGCARLRDPSGDVEHGDSRRFYNAIRNNDCVRIYSRDSWRDPTFSRCSPVEGCS